MYSKMPTKPKICIFFRFGLPTILHEGLESGRDKFKTEILIFKKNDDWNIRSQ